MGPTFEILSYFTIASAEIMLNRLCKKTKNFYSKKKEDLFKIIDLELKSVFKRIEEAGYTIELAKSAQEFLSEKGYDPDFGARPLARAIQKYLEDPLAEAIIGSTVTEGDVLQVKHEKDAEELTITVKKPKAEKKKK